MLQKRIEECFFDVVVRVFVSMIALKPSLGRPATRNGNSTDQGQALFRAMQMWKFTCFVVVAARQKQQKESEEAGRTCWFFGP